jgi:Amt family ammonium transporter
MENRVLMNKHLQTFRCWIVAGLALVVSLTAIAQAPAPATTPPPPAEPTLEQRVADIEAYMNNGARTANVATKVGGAGPGHNGWMMTSSALVLFMTLPGLALFYGGLVRKKNVLSVLGQCLGITGLVTILWWAVGFSLSFAPGNPIIGGLDYIFFHNVTSAPSTLPWVSQNVFAIFQLTFAIITPALIVGAIAERMKFSAVLLFVTLWMFAVYFPLAHMVWGGGLMSGAAGSIKAIDFAGGTVVHMSSGWSALVLCLIVGPRLGFGKTPMPPHSLVLCMVGTGMLWVGWYGFNAGSAGAADGIAANAFTTTTLAAAVASFTWGVMEFLTKKHASVLGYCTGVVSGLVVITPAAGYVTTSSAVIIGVLAGVIPFIFCVKLKSMFGYDDALDTFGVHAVGGTLGALLTGVFASPAMNPAIEPLMKGLLMEQIKAMVVTIVLSVVATAVIALFVKATIGLRPTVEAEQEGLDLADHGEEGYIYEAKS